MKTPKSLIVLIVVLAIIFIQDLVNIGLGGRLTADAYYLPLLELNLGELEQPIVDRIIQRHSEVVIYGRWFWGIAHGLALGLSLLVLRAIRQAKAQQSPN